MNDFSMYPSIYFFVGRSLCASVTVVYLPFFVFGRVLTRLGLTSDSAKL